MTADPTTENPTTDNPSTNNPTTQAFRVDSNDGMTIEWDVPIQVSDGLVLRADIFQPSAPGRYPVIASYGPYGKGRPSKN